MTGECFDDPGRIYKENVCLKAVSKNFEGELRLQDRDIQKCSDPECKTLKTIHGLKVEVREHDCDEVKRLNGVLKVERLATAFQDGDGERRGVHAGDFRWDGVGVVIAGRMSGITNAGTHRDPYFDPCQECYAPGIMEGRMCGSVVDTKDPELRGCYYVGMYRLIFDPSSGGGEGAIKGLFEGSLICPCHEG